MNDFTKEELEIYENIDYWVTNAKDIMFNMIGDDEISSSLKISSYLRGFYLEGKKHGIWISNNAPRY